MIIASAALVWAQNGGPGAAGVFVAVGFAAMDSRELPSLAALALAVTTFAVSAAHSHRSFGTTAGAELGIFAFYLIATFARRLQDARERTERLLVELEASQSAQAEAAALRERTRLARDMHDVLAHSLSGLMLQLEGARMLSARSDANGHLPAALDRAHHLARAGLEEARRAIGALRDEDLPGADRLRQLAAEPGVEVIGTACDGEEALALVEELNPDVVLMDLRMPRCDGVQATRRLRESRAAARVVVLTTYADDHSVIQALRAGACGFLTKDATNDEIRTALEAATRGESAIDPAVQHHLVKAIARTAPLEWNPPEETRLPDGLTPREATVLALIAEGLSNAEVAARLTISETIS